LKEKIVILILITQDFYNDNPLVNDNKTEGLLKDLNDTKDVMVENLNKILERDLKIEVVLSRAESLRTFSVTYKNRVSSNISNYRHQGLVER
jgi:hypothetical protein